MGTPSRHTINGCNSFRTASPDTIRLGVERLGSAELHHRRIEPFGVGEGQAANKYLGYAS